MGLQTVYQFDAKYMQFSMCIIYCSMAVCILDFEAFGQSGFQVGLGLGLGFEGLGLVNNITADNSSQRESRTRI